MKFTVSSQALKTSLKLLSGVINRSSPLPIVDCFLLEITEDKRLRVIATDLETTMIDIITVLNTDTTLNGIAIPHKIIIELLNTFSDIPLVIETDKNNNFNIQAGLGEYNISGYSAEDYPKTPEVDKKKTTVIISDVLRTGIKSTIYATGKEELRPVMTGIFIEMGNDISFTGTDAHVLVNLKHSSERTYPDGVNIILPKKGANILSKLLTGKVEELVNVYWNDTNIIFHIGNIELLCRLVDGRYPNYKAVIPQESTIVVEMERIRLIDIVKRVSTFTTRSTNIMEFDFQLEKVNISATDMDSNNTGKDSMPCNLKGESITIGFNSNYLLEILNNIDAEEIKICMTLHNRAALIYPLEEDTNYKSLHLIMPVMLPR